VIDLYRIGIKDVSNTRPIIIRFSRTDKRNEVLRNRVLPFKKGGKDIQVALAPDRTRQEREEHKQLLAELKKRKTDEENENLVIRNGKIVSRRPFRYKPQIFWGCHLKSTKSNAEKNTTEESREEQHDAEKEEDQQVTHV
jgi:hypothetical protein